jgi:hypothetical protein
MGFAIVYLLKMSWNFVFYTLVLVQDILVSLLHTEGLLGEGEEEQVHTQYALVEKWREVEKESSSSLLNPILN